MADGFEGDIAQFSAAHKQVEEAHGTMNSALNNLRGEMEAIRSGWEGEAPRAFQKVMDRFDENALKLHESLRGIGEQLQAAGSTYEAQEMEAQEQVGKISAGLDD